MVGNVPPANVPMLDANGCVTERWFEFFTRTSVGATQADEEAGTVGKVVTADVQQFHPSAAKCWAYVTVSTGTPTLTSSYNITSITDTGVGDLTITIATDFSSANWCGICTNEWNAVAAVTQHMMIVARAAGSVELINVNATPALADPVAWNFIGFGDQ